MVEGIGNKPIQGGFSNTQGIDGGTNVGGTKETKETKETKGTGLRGQLMTETVEKKNGATVSTAPQLTPPAGNYNAAETANSILNVLGNLSNDDPSKGLFILYQLLALLQRALNEMQQSMQVMRQAETNVAIANIQAEADTISSSAQWSLWLGIASGLVQMGASAFSIYGGIRGVSQTMKAKSTGEQLKTAQAELATLKAADAPDANAIAAKQLEMTGLKTKMDIHLSTANSISTKHQAIGQGVGSVAQFTKAGADGVAGAKQADAKRIEAKTKTMEATANEVADLTKAIKDMLTAILQLMQAVNRNEVDTNAQIMRGI
jgi:hypothetical protein